MNLIGWEHFNISIIETCALDKLGERENFFLQNYLPLLNSVFSSSVTETAINTTLKAKLDSLRKSNSSTSFKYNVPLYVYDLREDRIENTFIYFKSIQEASLALEINATSLSQYRDTSVPYRGKLIYTKPGAALRTQHPKKLSLHDRTLVRTDRPYEVRSTKGCYFYFVLLLRTSYFVLRTSYFVLRTSYFVLRTS